MESSVNVLDASFEWHHVALWTLHNNVLTASLCKVFKQTRFRLAIVTFWDCILYVWLYDGNSNMKLLVLSRQCEPLKFIKWDKAPSNTHHLFSLLLLLSKTKRKGFDVLTGLELQRASFTKHKDCPLTCQSTYCCNQATSRLSNRVSSNGFFRRKILKRKIP